MENGALEPKAPGVPNKPLVDCEGANKLFEELAGPPGVPNELAPNIDGCCCWSWEAGWKSDEPVKEEPGWLPEAPPNKPPPAAGEAPPNRFEEDENILKGSPSRFYCVIVIRYDVRKR